MPIYEYLCEACKHHFDMLQKIHEEPVKICPKCGKNKTRRLVSAAAFQLKGDGWYVTDFKNKDKKETPKDKAASTQEKSSENKPSKEGTKVQEPTKTSAKGDKIEK